MTIAQEIMLSTGRCGLPCRGRQVHRGASIAYGAVAAKVNRASSITGRTRGPLLTHVGGRVEARRRHSKIASSSNFVGSAKALLLPVVRNLEPQQLPPALAQHQKREQSLKGQGRNHKQINRRDRPRVVPEKRLPALRPTLHYVFRRPSTGRPQSRRSTARHGSETPLGFLCSSVG
jgi:hypothetical protein